MQKDQTVFHRFCKLPTFPRNDILQGFTKFTEKSCTIKAHPLKKNHQIAARAEVRAQPTTNICKAQAIGAYLISNWRSSTVSMPEGLLPEIHTLTLAGFSLILLARFIAVRAALGQAAIKRRGRMMDVPPVPLAAAIAAVAGHRLQIKGGS